MPKVAGEPLRKVTLNLFESDVEWLKEVYGEGYSVEIRDIVRRRCTEIQTGAQDA